MLFLLLYVLLFGPLSLLAQESSSTHTMQTHPAILIKNNIEPKDTVYRKYCMNHYPTNFTIYVNGKKVDQNSAIDITEQTFNVIYSYEWNPPWGKIQRAKEVTFRVTDRQKPIDLQFKSWSDPYRIHATNAQPISTQEVKLTELTKK